MSQMLYKNEEGKLVVREVKVRKAKEGHMAYWCDWAGKCSVPVEHLNYGLYADMDALDAVHKRYPITKFYKIPEGRNV